MFHEGIDIPAPTVTSVIAAASSHVTMVRNNSGYGFCVKVTNDSCMAVYAHLSGLGVHKGDNVEAQARLSVLSVLQVILPVLICILVFMLMVLLLILMSG